MRIYCANEYNVPILFSLSKIFIAIYKGLRSLRNLKDGKTFMDIENSLQNLELMNFSDTKVTLTDNMFHIIVWDKMNMKQRVRLLQVLENNLSCKDGRCANKIEIYPKLPGIATSSRLTGKIKISQWNLKYGENGLSDMNAQLYCAICHEHEHFNQFIDVESDKIDKKTENFRINLKSRIPYGTTVQEYIDYRLQPIEYYAHKLSEEQTISTFLRLEREFGEDKGFRAWYKVISYASVENLVQLYNREYGTTYTFDELYTHILNKIAIHEKGPKL